jgi:predicted HTH domain antitoxin
MIDDRDVREAISLYVHDAVSEAEAARIAGISRAQFRHYARTCGVVASPPTGPDDPKPSSGG